MFHTDTIAEIAHDIPNLYAFRITGEVGRDDMKAMSEFMLGAFKAHDTVDMCLVFETDAGSKADASLSDEAVKAQAKSLRHVRNYVVAGAPDKAASMVETMGKVLPVEAKSFATEAEAFAWLRQQAHAA
ncbi:SpoIIAA-like [Tranquillimonas rosea]|uniref:SpoIIAA-like n=1 Tax=Tranquillimonas rosea TaxID=641238 RepID=A0A1H9THP5_9RHOB|nr:STAS/SEC14 domain-containing protein [Tranquillimonas rosea]SER96715.1 SpoIIAA-like [Tranquillimonas rosea]